MSEGDGWNISQKHPGWAGQIIPINDIIDHTERFCICKPLWKFHNTDTGIATVIRHNSLDGREGTWVE